MRSSVARVSLLTMSGVLYPQWIATIDFTSPPAVIGQFPAHRGARRTLDFHLVL